MPQQSQRDASSIRFADSKASVNRDPTTTRFSDGHRHDVDDDGPYRSRSISNEDDDSRELQALLNGQPAKSNSIAIIFSLWSVMIGSTILLMPSMARETGVYTAAFGTLFICIINSYTAVLMEKLGNFYQGDCSHVVNQFGRIGYYITTPASVLIFVGAMIIYESYITDAIMTLSHLDLADKKWRSIVSCSIGGLMFFVGLLRSIKPLVRVASSMVLVITLMMVFIVVKSGLQLGHSSCEHDNVTHGLSWTGFGPLINLLSAMSLSLFCHNMITSITNESTNKKNISRDIFIAFFATAASNIGPAIMAVYAFRNCKTIEADFLGMFDDPFATVARVGISILVAVVYPILLFNARGQALQMIFGPDFPYWSHVAFNVICLVACTAPVAFQAKLTMIAAFAGVCAIVFTLIMPVFMWIQHSRIHAPENVTVLFWIVHGFLFLFGLALMILTILSQAGVPLG